jgi:hypothetical protein
MLLMRKAPFRQDKGSCASPPNGRRRLKLKIQIPDAGIFGAANPCGRPSRNRAVPLGSRKPVGCRRREGQDQSSYPDELAKEGDRMQVAVARINQALIARSPTRRLVCQLTRESARLAGYGFDYYLIDRVKLRRLLTVLERKGPAHT